MNRQSVESFFAPLTLEQGLHLLDSLTWFPSADATRWQKVADYVSRNTPASPHPSADTCRTIIDRILQAGPGGATSGASGRWRDIPEPKWLYQLKYDLMAALYPDDWFLFMNMGYAREHSSLTGASSPDQLWQYATNLYKVVADQVQIAGRDVLEVGSGRGGGANFVATTYHPSHLIGVDYSPANVEFCKRRFSSPNLRFVLGDSEKLPFMDASFDTVLNVESAHCYPDVGQFFREVWRVLKPGGYLLLADEWWTPKVKELRRYISSAGLQILAEDDLTDGVIRALRCLHEQATALLATMPDGQQKLLYKRFFIERVCRESAYSYTSGRFVFRRLLAVR